MRIITFWDSKNGLIFYLGIVSGRKVNVVGTFEFKNKKFPIVFKSIWKKKVREL